MRVALVADVHGNRVALEAALGAVERLAPDAVVCLGDVAAGGPEPAACLERLHALGGPMVLGNADAELLGPAPAASQDPTTRPFHEIEAWNRTKLTAAHRAFLESFSPTVALALGGGAELLCCHGSPRSYDERLDAWTPEAAVSAWLGGRRADVLACGHTHEPLLRRLGARVLVNPGSVGMPHLAGRNPLWAEYAVVDWGPGGAALTLRRAPVGLDALRRSVRQSGMPHADWWLKDWR